MKSKTGWEGLVDSKTDQVVIESKRSIRGFQMMRASGPVDGAPIDVFRAMSPAEF